MENGNIILIPIWNGTHLTVDLGVPRDSATNIRWQRTSIDENKYGDLKPPMSGEITIPPGVRLHPVELTDFSGILSAPGENFCIATAGRPELEIRITGPGLDELPDTDEIRVFGRVKPLDTVGYELTRVIDRSPGSLTGRFFAVTNNPRAQIDSPADFTVGSSGDYSVEILTATDPATHYSEIGPPVADQIELSVLPEYEKGEFGYYRNSPGDREQISEKDFKQNLRPAIMTWTGK